MALQLLESPSQPARNCANSTGPSVAGPQDTGPCPTCFSLLLANAEVFLQVSSLLLTVNLFRGMPSSPPLGLTVNVIFAQRSCDPAQFSVWSHWQAGPSLQGLHGDRQVPLCPKSQGQSVLRCTCVLSLACCQGRAQGTGQSFPEVL